MKLELKILGLMSGVIITGLTLMNIVNLYLLSNSIDKVIKYEVILHYILWKNVPPYAIVTDHIIDDNNKEYVLIDFVDNKFLFIKKDIKYKKLFPFAYFVFIIEVLIISFSLLILNRALNLYSLQKEALIRVTETISLAITHKFSNILSALRLNIEALKNTCTGKEEKRVLERINHQYALLNNTFSTLSKFLSVASKEDIFVKKQKLSIKHIIQDVLLEQDYMEYQNKYIHLYGGSLNIWGNKELIKLAVSILIENAFKYSNKFVTIRICRKGFVILNDIGNSPGGIGIGLILAGKILEMHDLSIKRRQKNNRYIVVVHEKFT